MSSAQGSESPQSWFTDEIVDITAQRQTLVSQRHFQQTIKIPRQRLQKTTEISQSRDSEDHEDPPVAVHSQDGR